MEEWKQFFENYYISNHGNCKKVLENGNETSVNCPISNSGYRRFRVKRNSKNINMTIHCLVASNFIGDRPDNLVVDHIDRNKLNNNVNNLRYVTVTENNRNRSNYRNDILTTDRRERQNILNTENRRKNGIPQQNVGHIEKRGERLSAQILVKGKKYNATFDTKEECENFFKRMKDPEADKTIIRNRCGKIGTIKERSGKFQGVIMVKGKHYAKTFKTKEECEVFLRQMKEQHG